MLCFNGGESLLVAGLVAAGAWLLVAAVGWIAVGVWWGFDESTTVTVREGATVSRYHRVYHGGERIIVSSADARELREEGVVE